MDIISERRSIRRYKSTEPDKTVIDEIIRAGMLAPSAKNRQPWKFIVYRGASKVKLLNEMERGLINGTTDDIELDKNGLPDAFYTLNVMKEAPVLIIVVNTNGKSIFDDISTGERVTEICDTLSIGAAVQNMLLKTTELGLGSLWIANTCYAYNELVKYVGIDKQLVCAVAIGYPDDVPNPRKRKDFSVVAEYR